MQRSDEYYERHYPEYNRTCPVCGKRFNAYQTKPKTRKTCSPECSALFIDKMRRDYTRIYKQNRRVVHRTIRVAQQALLIANIFNGQPEVFDHDH